MDGPTPILNERRWAGSPMVLDRDTWLSALSFGSLRHLRWPPPPVIENAAIIVMRLNWIFLGLLWSSAAFGQTGQVPTELHPQVPPSAAPSVAQPATSPGSGGTTSAPKQTASDEAGTRLHKRSQMRTRGEEI